MRLPDLAGCGCNRFTGEFSRSASIFLPFPPLSILASTGTGIQGTGASLRHFPCLIILVEKHPAKMDFTNGINEG